MPTAGTRRCRSPSGWRNTIRSGSKSRIAPDDYEGHKRIAEKTAIPIATGENEYTRYGFRDLIATGSVPILNPDAMVLGGVTEFMKVAALAQAHDLDIAPHGAQALHIHLVSAIANGLILEFYPRYLNPM